MNPFLYPGFLWKPYGLFCYFLGALGVLILSPVVLLFAFIGNRRLTSKYIRMWFRWVIFVCRIRIDFIDKSQYDSEKPYLIISNHQSHMDIPILWSLLHGDIRMAAKKELFKIPIFGLCMKAGEFIAVDRSANGKKGAAAKAIAEKLESGLQIWVAPEGTRTPDGDIKNFKAGSFAVALESQTPIQPILVVNAFDAFSKFQWVPKAGSTIRVVALPEVPTLGRNVDERHALAAEIRESLKKELQLQREHLKENP